METYSIENHMVLSTESLIAGVCPEILSYPRIMIINSEI